MNFFHDLNKENLRITFISTFIFGLLAHAFSYFNIFLNHDSLLINSNNNFEFYEIHGRFFIRFLSYINGGLTVPFINGIFSLLFLSLACFILINILKLKNKLSIILTCGIFATCPILSVSNASYIFFSDVYMFAFMLSMLAVLVYEKYKMGFLWAIPLLVCSLGLYQSYIQTSAILLCILFVKGFLIENLTFKHFFKRGIQAFFMFFMSMVIYYIIIKYFNSDELGSYRNYNTLGDYSDLNIISLLLHTYYYPLHYLFVEPIAYVSEITKIHNFLIPFHVFIALYIIISTVYLAIANKISKFSFLLIAIIGFLMPFAMGFMVFLARQYLGVLIYHSIYFLLILAIVFIDFYKNNEFKCSKFTKTLSSIVCILLCISIFSNIIYANQLYVYKDLHFKGTLSLVTRVVDRIEKIDEFDPAKHQVLFIGETMLNKNYEYAKLLNAYDPKGNIEPNGTTTYNMKNYLEFVLGLNYNFLEPKQANKMKLQEEIIQMPMYPHKDSIKIIDDVLVVKISPLPPKE